MVKLIAGEKGKGKTKYILDMANAEAKQSDGVVIYLDKSSKHMFELDRNIRLINVREYPIDDFDVLMGFICGLIAAVVVSLCTKAPGKEVEELFDKASKSTD